MTVKVIFGQVIIDALVTLDSKYLEVINSKLLDILESPKVLWSIDQGVQIIQQRIPNDYEMITSIFIYGELDEKLATEYYLRF
jgi:hypothetical protein